MLGAPVGMEPPDHSPTLPVSRHRLLPSLAAALLALSLTACGEKPVAHYRISKDPASTARATASPGMMAGGAAPAAGVVGGAHTAARALGWTAPDTWASQPASPPRWATYVVTGADGASAELAVTSFPGDVGGELPNVNRWRGQVLLNPMTPAEHAAAVNRFRVGELEVAVVDFTGGDAETRVRLLGALVPFKDATWFFKFTGDPAVIEQEKPAFLALLQTLHSSTNDHACCDS
jgi:hypothetical protein